MAAEADSDRDGCVCPTICRRVPCANNPQLCHEMVRACILSCNEGFCGNCAVIYGRVVKSVHEKEARCSICSGSDNLLLFYECEHPTCRQCFTQERAIPYPPPTCDGSCADDENYADCEIDCDWREVINALRDERYPVRCNICNARQHPKYYTSADDSDRSRL